MDFRSIQLMEDLWNLVNFKATQRLIRAGTTEIAKHVWLTHHLIKQKSTKEEKYIYGFSLFVG